MQGKIILNLAMSLDGFIASEDGSYDWIAGHGDHTLDTAETYEFESFLKETDLIIMGKRCYEQGMHKEFPGRKVLVAVSELPESPGKEEQVSFITGNIVEQVCLEREQGKRIYLFGGGILVHEFLAADVIDEYVIGIIPVILGSGRKLFTAPVQKIGLTLQKYIVQDGTAILYYSKK